MLAPSRSFTTAAQNGLLNVLRNRCGVSQAFDPRDGANPPPICEFDAIWDTGATNSVITQKVIDTCGLVATGMARVQSVSGPAVSETYLVSIALPNKVIFPGVRVTRGTFLGADILIGMDIINQGDFAVTNHKKTSKFSFRIPSLANIDFVAEAQKNNRASQPGGTHAALRPKREKDRRKKKK